MKKKTSFKIFNGDLQDKMLATFYFLDAMARVDTNIIITFHFHNTLLTFK